MTQSQVDVSIIIVNWNTRDYLEGCLSSVFEQTNEVEFEVIVVDNGSTDDSVTMVRQEFPQLEVIANEENRGFPAANNQGFEISNGRYVLLLNSDTLVLDGAIQKLIWFADEHPEGGAFGGAILDENRNIDPLCLRTRYNVTTAWLEYLFLHKFAARIRSRHLVVREVDVLVGAYMLVRSSVLQQIGGLDEKFFLSAEDIDWCLRIREAGWKIYFYPQSKIIHYGSGSFKRSWDRGVVTSYHSKEILFSKHYDVSAMVLLRGAAVIGSIIRLFGWIARSLFTTGTEKDDAILRSKAYWQVVKQALGIQSFHISRANIDALSP